jgi:glycosyltransferase involved in cell wall biosynthesis
VRVLCFADTRFPIERANGVQTIETCHALARRGHDVTLLVRPDTAETPRDPFAFYGLAPEARLMIRTIPARGSARARRLRFLVDALRIAAGDRQAVVLTRDLGLAAWLLQIPKVRRPRVVYESHGVAAVVAEDMPALLGKPELKPSSGKLKRLDRRERRVWSHASSYVTITRALADELADRYGGRPRVFVVPDGARRAETVPPPDPATFIAGYAGHLYPWKGVDVFVRSLVHAPGVHGLIVGGHPAEPDLDRVKRLIRDLELDTRITLTPMVAPGEVVRHLAPASVLVLPNPPSPVSDRYTSPLKLFEYLGMGRAIVASDLQAIREVLNDKVAVLVPAGDERALGAALSKLEADRDTVAALGRAALQRAPRFTWDKRAERLGAALEAARRS